MATSKSEIDELIERARTGTAPDRELVGNTPHGKQVVAAAARPRDYEIHSDGVPFDELVTREGGGSKLTPPPRKRAAATTAPAPSEIDALLQRSRLTAPPSQMRSMSITDAAAFAKAEEEAAIVSLPAPKVPVAPFDAPPTRDQVARRVKLNRDDAEYAAESAEAGKLRSVLGAFTGGVGSTVAGIPESLGELYLAAENKVTGTPERREDNPLIRMGEGIRRATRGPINPEHADDFSTALAQGFGSTVGFLAGGIAGKAVKLGGATGAAILGAATVGAEGARDAAAHDADADTRFSAFLLNAGLGVTEAAPISAVLNRLDKGSGGFLSRYMSKTFLKNVAAQGLAGAFEEAIQEGIQNAGSNAIAKALYDADRKILEDVPEGTAVGGVVGFVMSALMTALGGRNRMTDLGGNPLVAPPKGPAERAAEAAAGKPGATPPPPPSAPGAARPAEEMADADTLLGADPEEELPGPSPIPDVKLPLEPATEPVLTPEPSDEAAEINTPAPEATAPEPVPTVTTEPPVTLTPPPKAPPITPPAPQEPEALEEEEATAPLPEPPAPPTTLTPPPAQLPPISEQIKAEEEAAAAKPKNAEEELKGMDENEIDDLFDDLEGVATPDDVTQSVTPGDGIARTPEDLATLASDAATSETNGRPEPGEGQKEHGNYRKPKIRIEHLPTFRIENPLGSKRKGTRADGTTWENELKGVHYGYFTQSTGADNEDDGTNREGVDVFVGPNATDAALPTFVIDQKNDDGSFDEHKVMLGFATEEEALKAYNDQYDEGWDGAGAITQMSADELKAFVKDEARTTKPVAYQPGKVDTKVDTPVEPQAAWDAADYMTRRELLQDSILEDQRDNLARLAWADLSPRDRERITEHVPLKNAEREWSKLTRAGKQDLLERAGIRDIQGVSGAAWRYIRDEDKAAIARAIGVTNAKQPEAGGIGIKQEVTQAEATELFDETQKRLPKGYRLTNFDGEVAISTPNNISIPWVSNWRSMKRADLAREFDKMVAEARRRSDARVDEKEQIDAEQSETSGSADGDLTDAVAAGEREPGEPEPQTPAGDQEPDAGADPGAAGTATDESQPASPDVTEPRSYPEPNKHGAYSADTAEKIDFAVGNKKRPTGKAEIRVLEIGEGQWIGSLGYDFTTGNMTAYGGPLSPAGREVYPSRDATVAAKLRYLITRMESVAQDKTANEAQRDAARKIAAWARGEIDKVSKPTPASVDTADAGVEFDALKAGVRSYVLTSPEIVGRLMKAGIADFADEARIEIAKYLRQLKNDKPEQAELIDKLLPDGKLSPFFSDLYFATLRADVVAKDTRNKKKPGVDPGSKRKKPGGIEQKNTGEALRRHWELIKGQIDGADQSDTEAFVDEIKKATMRANVFIVDAILGEGHTPGARRYLAGVRDMLPLFDKDVIGRRRGYYGRHETLLDLVQNGRIEQGELLSLAHDYVKLISETAQLFEGVRTIDEIVAVVEKIADKSPLTNSKWSHSAVNIFARFKKKDSSHSRYQREKAIEDKTDDELGEGKSKLQRQKRELKDLERDGMDDIRKGEDVNTDQLKKRFGFVDVVIGEKAQEKANQARTTQHVNFAYEAFHDLADVWGIDEQNISLFDLWFAVGALGHGRHSAHYSPNHPREDGDPVRVINVTHTAGDGTVAHEWTHALDYATRARLEPGKVSATQNPVIAAAVARLKYRLDESYREWLRKKLDEFLDPTSTMYYPDMGKGKKAIADRKMQAETFLRRAKNELRYLSGTSYQLNKTRYFSNALSHPNKNYWANKEELLARAGEAWVYDKLQAKGASNDYLVSDWVADGKVKKPAFKITPYPEGDERELVDEIFTLLSENIEFVDGSIYFKEGTLEALRKPADDAIQMLTDMENDLDAYAAKRKEKHEREQQRKKDERESKKLSEEAERQRQFQERLEAERARAEAELEVAVKKNAEEELRGMDENEIDDLFDDLEDDGESADQFNTDKENGEHTGSPDFEPGAVSEDPLHQGQLKLIAALTGSLPKRVEQNAPMSNQQLFDLADASIGGTQGAGDYTKKDAYDALEVAVNQVILNELVAGTNMADDAAAIDWLNKLTSILPTQANRTTEQVEFQMFSTPPALAFMAARAADIRSNDRLLEPSAGTGSLLLYGKAVGAFTIANELSLRRAILLEEMGPDMTFNLDAQFINNLSKENVAPTVVLMNPPFSSAAGHNMKNDTKRGAAHVESALKLLRPGGRLVAIVGRGMGRDKASFRDWWQRIDKAYEVRAAIPLSGSLYKKYGTTFDNVLLVIDKTDTPTHDVVTGPPITDLQKLAVRLGSILNDRPEPTTESPGEQPGRKDAGKDGAKSGSADPGPAGPDVDGPRVPPRRPDQPPPGRPPAGGRGGSAGRGPGGGARGPGAGGGRSGTDTGAGKGTQPGGTGPAPDLGAPPADGGKSGGLPGPLTSDQAEAELAKLFGKKKGVEEEPAPYGDNLPKGVDPDLLPQVQKMIAAAWDKHRLTKSLREFAIYLKETYDPTILPYVRVFAQVEAKRLANTPQPPSNEPQDSDKDEVLQDRIQEPWSPTIDYPGAKPHPGKLVEATAMAAVKLPPTDYKPKGIDDLIKSGDISDAQLEAVIYAGYAHSSTVKDDEGREARRGIVLADGTGFGKTRELIGILADNYAQGRKKSVFLSQNPRLLPKLERDIRDMGLEDKFPVQLINRTHINNKVGLRHGILYVTYKTMGDSIKTQEGQKRTGLKNGQRVKVDFAIPGDGLRQGHTGKVVSVAIAKGQARVLWDGDKKPSVVGISQISAIGPTKTDRTRAEQIVEWLGADYDGVIVMDEAHNMSNSRSNKPAAKALAGLQLQELLPNARIVYATATAAVEVNHLAYMKRLGLWGEGTQFKNVDTFIAEIKGGGVRAMEKVVADLKALGMYLSRSISMEDVTKDPEPLVHTLTKEQEFIYDRVAQAWQTVVANIDAAAEITNTKNERRQKQKVSQLWGFQQRLFQTMLVAMKAPTLFEQMDAALANGESILIQGFKTNEAQNDRAALRAKELGVDLAEVELSPKEDLINLVKKVFPTDQYIEGTDENGNPIVTPVYGPDGEIMKNEDAVAMLDELVLSLNDIRFPEALLDQVINKYGADNVAEMTSRSERPIRAADGSMDMKKTPGQTVDGQFFQDGQKRILYFTQSGSTGEDYHSGLNFKNQQRRRHFLVDSGWSAATTMQGLGRGNRANQANAPHLSLISTNVKSEMRFTSTIARRLDQVGAMSTGERKTGGSGVLSSDMNLETIYAVAALETMISSIADGRVRGDPNQPDRYTAITPADFVRETGLPGAFDQNGKANLGGLPTIPRFMNRMLSMTLDRQEVYFDYFAALMRANIEAAIANGTYDLGLETLVHESAEKVHEEVVSIDERTGAETKYVKIETRDPAKYLSFNETHQMGLMGIADLLFYGVNRSGEIGAYYTAPPVTRDGVMVDRYRRYGIRNNPSYPDQSEVRTDGYSPNVVRIDNLAEARARWDEEVASADPVVIHDLHLITGVLLNVWNAVKSSSRVVRIKDNAGTLHLGQAVHPMNLSKTLTALSATGGIKIVHTPESVFERIGFGWNAVLGGYGTWRIDRRYVSKEQRIELQGPQGFDKAELEAAGVLLEVIQHKTRYFIPNRAPEGVTVLRNLLKNHPVTSLNAPGVQETAASYGKRDDASALTNELADQVAKESARDAEIDNYQGRIDTFAIAFNKDLINTSAAPLVGHTIETPEDLARLAQRYRDPRYETLRYFFLDAKGRVVGQTGVSSRMPGTTMPFPEGEDAGWGLRAAQAAGAKTVYMLHNHPSGNARPSDQDRSTTVAYANMFDTAGIDLVHVVIDSNEYSVMMPTPIPGRDVGQRFDSVAVNERAKLELGEDKLLKPGKPHHLLGFDIVDPKDFARFAKGLEQRADVVSVVGRNAQMKVIAIASMSADVYTGDYPALKKELQTWARAHGANDIFLIGVPDSDTKRSLFSTTNGVAERLIRVGVVRDALNQSGRSAKGSRAWNARPLGIAEGGGQVVAEEPPRYENDVTRNQETTLERLKLNQPIDRLLRGMFTGFGLWKGVLNSKGEFKAGSDAHNRMVNFLKEGQFNPDGGFGWMNNLLEHVRHGLIDRYKVPKEFIQRSFEAITQEREILGKGLEFLKRLQESGVSSLEEAMVIQQMLTSEDVDENQWSAITEEIRASIVELGQMALELGLITQESYERNKGIYLHRVYQKYEGLSEENSLTRWLARLGGRRHVIKGDELKGRGIFKDVSLERLLRDAPKVAKSMEGKPGSDLIGQKFIIMDFYDPEKTDPDTDTSIVAKRSRAKGRPRGLSKRVYWPADEELPRRFLSNGWVNQGSFVVRRIKGEGFVLWRDFNKAERTQMGEILDARYTLAKTYHLLAKDLASGALFRDIAANEEWTWPKGSEPPAELVADRSKVLREYVGYEWVLVPNNKIPRSPAKKWGDLAGRYVRAEIWKDLNEVDRMNQKGPWQWLLTQWKLNKTARNPVVHMNNVISNLALMDLIDVSATDLYRGLLAYVEKGDDYMEAFHNGAFGSSYIDQEVMDSVLKPILREMQKMAREGQLDSGAHGYMAKVKFANQFARIVSEGVRRFDDKSQDLYRIEDEVFRMATYIKRRKIGEAPAEAATLAREQFLNYDIRAPWVNAARRSVLPFIAYTYRAVPAITEAIMRRPWKLAKYAIIANVANSLAYAVADDDEELERNSMRDEIQGDVWIPGVPRMIRLPADDKNGNPVYLDIRRWVPAGDVFDVAPNNPIPIPAWLHFGGPLMIAGELMLNRSAFTGEDIVDPLVDTLGDKSQKYGAFLYRSLAPSAPWIPESWYWQKIGNAATGVRDTLGRSYSLPQAILSSVGVKAAGHDVTLNYQYRAREFDRTYTALRATLRQAARDYERGILSEGAYREMRADTLEKLERLGTKREQTFGRIDELH